jgi:hypothetical protein
MLQNMYYNEIVILIMRHINTIKVTYFLFKSSTLKIRLLKFFAF